MWKPIKKKEKKEEKMKKMAMILLAIVVCIGLVQITRSTSHALAANCWGGYECGNPGDQGAKCGTDKDSCECKFRIFIGTVCKEISEP